MADDLQWPPALNWLRGLPVRVRRKRGGQVGAIMEYDGEMVTIHWGRTYKMPQVSREPLDLFELLEAGQVG